MQSVRWRALSCCVAAESTGDEAKIHASELPVDNARGTRISRENPHSCAFGPIASTAQIPCRRQKTLRILYAPFCIEPSIEARRKSAHRSNNHHGYFLRFRCRVTDKRRIRCAAYRSSDARVSFCDSLAPGADAGVRRLCGVAFDRPIHQATCARYVDRE